MIRLLKRALSDRKILRAAICSAPVPIAIYNDDDQLIAWSPGYEQLHTQAFSDHKESAEAGNLTYRDIMRYTVDSRLCAADAEAELDRLVNSTRENDGTPDIKTYGESSHFKVYRYRLPSGARAGIAMDVSELLETQKQLTVSRNEAEDAIRRLADASAEIQSYAYSDELTGLPNRRMLMETLVKLQDGTTRADRKIVLLHIDLDRFKQVNDVFGHAAGDHVLREVAKLLQSLCRPDDLAVRLGGDEFVMLLDDDIDSRRGRELAGKIVDQLSKPIYYKSSPCRIGASIGVSENRCNEVGIDHILSQSDLAMYRAKQRGRNRVEHFDTKLQSEFESKLLLGDDIHTAIEEERFILFYQPQYRCSDMKWIGVEALCRWQLESGEVLTPGRFFETAKSLSLLGDIERCTFQRVSKDLDFFESADMLPPKISLNVGYERLLDGTLTEDLASLQRPGLDIAVELLETLALEDLNSEFMPVLESLKKMGIQIEIDDFGSDHASINSLVSISPSAMKIDQRIVLPGPSSEKIQKLIQAIVDIGSALDIPIIAEGVETDEHVRMVRDLGCDYMQGYALSKPMSREELLHLFGPEQHSRLAA